MASGWFWALAVAVLIAGLLAFGLTHGAVQVALGQVKEPVENISPARLQGPLGVRKPVHILLLGTSLTARGDWPTGLERQLSACHGSPVMVERLAKPGANSAWGAAALRDRLAVGPAPDALVVEFSINDSSLWRGMTLAASRARHEEILQMAGAADVPVWLATMNPAFGRKAWERPGQVAYRALYADLAAEQGAGLVAMVPAWLALSVPDRQHLIPDGLHPTEAAMEGVAMPRLVTALEKELCDQG